MTNLYIAIATDGDSNDQTDNVRQLIDNSELAKHLKGEFVQCNMGNDRGGLFHKPAEDILAARPDYPETGFKEIVERFLPKARNPVGVFIDYEPGQGTGGQNTGATDRFDTGIRNGPYRHAEISLASRCVEQIRSTSEELGYKNMLCGFYNLPSGMGDRANALALRGIYYTAGMDYVFTNMNYTRSPREDYANLIRGVKLRKQQFAVMGEAAPKVIAWTMSRDNSFDGGGNYPQHWVDPKAMRAKGMAAKAAGVDLVLWLNEAWFEREQNIQPIVDGFNQLGIGLNGKRHPVRAFMRRPMPK